MHRSTESIQVQYNPDNLTEEQLRLVERSEYYGVELEKQQRAAWVPTQAAKSGHMLDFWRAVKPGIISIENHAIGGDYTNIVSDYAVMRPPERPHAFLEDGYHIYLRIDEID